MSVASDMLQQLHGETIDDGGLSTCMHKHQSSTYSLQLNVKGVQMFEITKTWRYMGVTGLQTPKNHRGLLQDMSNVAPPGHERDLTDSLTTCLKAVWRQEEALDCMLH